MKCRIGVFLLTILLALALCPAALAAGPVRVAVIDTGVSSTVVDAANLAPGKNYILSGQSTGDRHGHGTSIASILVGSEIAGVDGLCPEAVIVPLVWTSRNDNGELMQGKAAMAAQTIRDAIDLYECQIINLSATTFSPAAPCTRGQMATFLCRMANGEPASNALIFRDVSAGAYYAKPVQWACEQNITGGTSASTFGPDANCTCAQMVTFLYRYFVENGNDHLYCGMRALAL